MDHVKRIRVACYSLVTRRPLRLFGRFTTVTPPPSHHAVVSAEFVFCSSQTAYTTSRRNAATPCRGRVKRDWLAERQAGWARDLQAVHLPPEGSCSSALIGSRVMCAVTCTTESEQYCPPTRLHRRDLSCPFFSTACLYFDVSSREIARCSHFMGNRACLPAPPP